MLLIKYHKSGVFAFISYLGCRDVIVQSIKRANIDVNYSQGFHPHELIYFSPPTSLGIEGYCEYMYIDTDFSMESEFMERFNSNAPMGLRIEYVKYIENKPKFYDLIDYAEYDIEFDCEEKIDTKILFQKLEEQSELKSQINDLKIVDNKISCILACGQRGNLKVSKFIDFIKGFYNISVNAIRKINLYKFDKELINIDSLL